jgi:hypothetical protein
MYKSFIHFAYEVFEVPDLDMSVPSFDFIHIPDSGESSEVVLHRSTLVASFATPVMLYIQSHCRRPANHVSNTSISFLPAYFSGGDTLIFLISG